MPSHPEAHAEQAPKLLLPATENGVAAGQAVQIEAPAKLYCPAGHTVHAVALVELYCPAGHTVHAVALVELYWPGEQSICKSGGCKLC